MNFPDEEFLRHEFMADDGSFVLQLRSELRWDEARFARLVEAMTACCEALTEADEDRLDRWVVEGFWFLHSFTPSWVRHEAFPRQRDQEYYEGAFELLDWLAEWAFAGYAPFEVDMRQLPEYRQYYPGTAPAA